MVRFFYHNTWLGWVPLLNLKKNSPYIASFLWLVSSCFFRNQSVFLELLMFLVRFACLPIWNPYFMVRQMKFQVSINYIPGWWFGTSFIFPYIGNFIFPTDELIFFRRVAQPPTSHLLFFYGSRQLLKRIPQELAALQATQEEDQMTSACFAWSQRQVVPWVMFCRTWRHGPYVCVCVCMYIYIYIHI